jgi:quinol-cytochrome oxidoreductase complex cytochrome b subunit
MEVKLVLLILAVVCFLMAGLWGLRYPDPAQPRVHLGWIGMALWIATLLFTR